ncbi:MAG TPA: TetR family transcriptional regulator [Clostridium sp.]|nr:TetR family transcriptional regulator [Clostridium sp.]
MKHENKTDNKQSFIAEARRAQITDAAIKTLDEIGYVKASLSQIAESAGISTALISYHFSDKNDLMNHLLMQLVERANSYISERVDKKSTSQEKLKEFIEASLTYQYTNPTHTIALIEIIFNARTLNDVPYYKFVGDYEEEPTVNLLREILRKGQENGEFGTFNIDVIASMIQGAIEQYMVGNTITKRVDLQTYSNELVSIVSKAVKGNV